MTRPKAECKKCGRAEGHYLNCPASPRPNEIIVPAFDPPAEDSICAEPGCEDPRKGIRYCGYHGSNPARVQRSLRKRAEKEDQDVERG